MSFDALAWAGKAKPGSAPRKLVLLALADRHNTEDGLAWPSIVWLSEWTDLNRKTIITALQDLETAGFIADSGVRKGATKQVKAYKLNLETVPQSEQSQKRNSSVLSREQSQKRDTEPVKEPVVEEANASPTGAWALPIGLDAQVWKDFLRNRKKKRLDNTETAWKLFLSDLARVSASSGIPPNNLIEVAAGKGWASINDPNDRGQTNGRSQPLQRNRPNLSDQLRAIDNFENAGHADHASDNRTRSALPSLGFG